MLRAGRESMPPLDRKATITQVLYNFGTIVLDRRAQAKTFGTDLLLARMVR